MVDGGRERLRGNVVYCTFYEFSAVDLAGGDFEGYDMVLEVC